MRYGIAILVAAIMACSGPARQYETGIRVRPLTKKEAARLLGGAKNHLGEPYVYGGAARSGWDCSGFTSGMYYKYLSYYIPRKTSSIYAQSVKIPSSKKRAGDLVFFKIKSKTASHVGIYIGEDRFIHASTSNGIVISNLKDDYYRKSFMGYRRPLLALAD
ncbi:MAG: C40 family peptidase [candidate division Zixibacteria bacterium]